MKRFPVRRQMNMPRHYGAAGKLRACFGLDVTDRVFINEVQPGSWKEAVP